MSFTSSYLQLDGVEFKISDSVQAPNFHGELPSNFRIRDPSSLLLESEYDFSKERKILEKIQAVRAAERRIAEQEEKRKQLSLKRRADADKQRFDEMMNQQREVLQRQRELFLEQKRKQIEENRNGETSTPDRVSPTEEAAGSSKSSPTSESVSEEPPPIPPRNPFLQIGKDDILTPQPAARKSQDPTYPPSVNRPNDAQPVVAGQDQIWVDFEDRELDPFTNMELQTIDDIAELQTVLQNAKIDPPPKVTPTEERECDEDLPIRSKETSPTFGIASGAADISMSRESSSSPAVEALAKTDPLLSDVKTISSKLQTIVVNSESKNTSEGGSNQIYENSVQLIDNRQSVGEQLLDNLVDRNSPEFVMPENPETLYENVTIAQVDEVAKKLEGPSKFKNPDESVYDFAKEPTADETNKTTQLQLSLARKPEDNFQTDPSTVYSVVGPKTHSVRSPDETIGSAQDHSSNRSNPVLTTQMPPPSPFSNPSQPVQPHQTYSRPETGNLSLSQINPIFPPSARHTPQGGTKVLPVSFGGVSNSLSSSALPPISSSVSNGGSPLNFTLGSMSAPNLSQRPIPKPRKPPIPPRDPIPAAPHTPTPPPIVPHAPSSSPNQTIATSGNSHLLPPYAMPKSNGPKVTLSSAASTVAYHKEAPSAQKDTPAPCSTEASFIQKSQQDRVKFAETVNKALSSLPKNPPKPIATHKPTTPAQSNHTPPSSSNSQAFSKYRPLPTRSLSVKSSILVGLSSEEQKFVNNVTSMGFDTQATIRAMEKFGLSKEEVIDYLCRVQEIAEQGFSTNTVQDALELFEKDNKSVIKYLQQASQLTDMGFKEDDVREALKANDNDQAKALDQLMGQT